MRSGLFIVAALALAACERERSGAEIARACGGSGDFSAQERISACDALLAFYDDQSPGYASVLATRGREKENSGDTEGALADYRAALTIVPDAPSSLLGMGRVHMARGESDAARPYLLRAIEVHNSVIARDLLGGEALLRGDNEEALSYYNAVLEVEPDPMHAIGYYGRGVARLRMGDEGGRADIEHAEEMSATIREDFEARGIRP